jgi:hypothetical protein
MDRHSAGGPIARPVVAPIAIAWIDGRGTAAAYGSDGPYYACIEPGCRERGALRQWRYHAFVDPSGGSNDAMTLAIAHKEGNTVILDMVRERRPPFSPEAVVEEFAKELKNYRITTVIGDRYAGEWPRERFRLHGVNYEPKISRSPSCTSRCYR